MKIKTYDLSGPSLAYAVSLADGWEPGTADMAPYLFTSGRVKPHVDWSQGGPIIEREKLDIAPDYPVRVERWRASHGGLHHAVGPTPLIAAMRCYVMSCLGDEVEIPDELLET